LAAATSGTARLSLAASSTRSTPTCHPRGGPHRPRPPPAIRPNSSKTGSLDGRAIICAHPDLGFLDQPNRALLRPADREANSSRCPPTSRRTRASDEPRRTSNLIHSTGAGRHLARDDVVLPSTITCVVHGVQGSELRIARRMSIPLNSSGCLKLVSRIGVPRLVVIAMKVVHPGKTGQAVGQHTHKLDRTIVRMNLHKNARLTPQVRLLLVRRITEKGWRVADAANAAGISVRQRYRWLARYGSGGAVALADRRSAPQRCKHRIGAEWVGEIERLRRQRMSGPQRRDNCTCRSPRSAQFCTAWAWASLPRSNRSHWWCALSIDMRYRLCRTAPLS